MDASAYPGSVITIPNIRAAALYNNNNLFLICAQGQGRALFVPKICYWSVMSCIQ